MARRFGILVGVATHALFTWTVYRLFLFLHGGHHGLLSAWAPVTRMPWYAWNTLLAFQFAVPHSWLLLPSTRKRLEQWVPSAFYGCLFCIVTCVSLLSAIECWQSREIFVWRLHGAAQLLVRAAFLACWPALIYSLSLTGLGYQTGWTPWFAWLRKRKPPARGFNPRGAYGLLRHPVYLSFLGLIWLTPAMTLDRAILTAVWTAYIYVGSTLKDRRLLHYIGEPYRQYQERVAGYPFIPIGPLARIPRRDAISHEHPKSPLAESPRRIAA
jgi:protein-S-isoprenylcysteine O-methyltransferase Ste14